MWYEKNVSGIINNSSGSGMIILLKVNKSTKWEGKNRTMEWSFIENPTRFSYLEWICIENRRKTVLKIDEGQCWTDEMGIVPFIIQSIVKVHMTSE